MSSCGLSERAAGFIPAGPVSCSARQLCTLREVCKQHPPGQQALVPLALRHGRANVARHFVVGRQGRPQLRDFWLHMAVSADPSGDGVPAEEPGAPQQAKPKRFPRGRYEQMRKYKVIRQGVTLPGGRRRWQKVAIPLEPRLRITGGTARGRRLESPPVYVRPAMAQVREACFSILRELQILPSRQPVSFLDLFCGAGTMGFEALSRGASSAVFVDRSPECCACVRRNMSKLGVGEGIALVRETTVEEYLATAPDGVLQIVALTPPYEEISYDELLRTLSQSAVISERTVVMLEYPYELGSLPPVIENRLIGMRNRRYGRTVLGMYACQPDPNWDMRTEEFTDAFIRRRRNYLTS
jgi:16S rRNA (guanine966-N2)-methyltransferase